MKKFAFGLVLLLALGVGLLAVLGEGGLKIGEVSVAWNEDAAVLEGLAVDFLEAVQFKDFADAASHHTWEDRQKSDIPHLIERLFVIKPEQLNIRQFRVVEVDLDRGGRRGRTHFKAVAEQLNSARNPREEQNTEREVEGILYWHKRPAREAHAADADPAALPPAGEERWFLTLESSLR